MSRERKDRHHNNTHITAPHADAADDAPDVKGDDASYEGQIAELLANLKVDPGNPDLWMEAATIYVALGRRHRASKAYRASIEAVTDRKGEDAALATVHRLLHGDDVPALETGASSPPESAAGDGGTSQLLVQETRDRLRDSVPPDTRGHKGTVGADLDSLEQLNLELDPDQTMTCPACNTLLEMEAPSCYGCGLKVTESGESLEERVGHAHQRLEVDADDHDALFTLAAHLAISGQHEEALEALIRLTALDPRYPGLWWVKARVFLDAGKTEAADASLKMAVKILKEGGSGPHV